MEYQRRKNPLKNSARDLSVYCKKLIFNPPELAKWEVEGVRGRSKVRGWLHGVINSEGGAKRVESFTYSSAYFADFISFSQRGAPFHPAIPPPLKKDPKRSQKRSQKIPKRIQKRIPKEFRVKSLGEKEQSVVNCQWNTPGSEPHWIGLQSFKIPKKDPERIPKKSQRFKCSINGIVVIRFRPSACPLIRQLDYV